VRTNPPRDEDHLVYVPVESCKLLTGIQLVYADDRDRQRTMALEGAALIANTGTARSLEVCPETT
jgi:hypothetical protein